MTSAPVRVVIADDEPLGRERLRGLLGRETGFVVVAEAVDGDDAVAKCRETKPDLLFLDIRMPGKTGFEALRELATEAPPAVIFVTAHDDFALQAFDVHAVDYLVKPFDRGRFQTALGRAVSRIGQDRADPQTQRLETLLDEMRGTPDRIPIKSAGRILFIDVADIDWVGSADNYVELHVGPQSHLIRKSMQQMEASLPNRHFVRISRTVIVNIRAVKELAPLFHGEYAVTLKTGVKLTLSRTHRDQLPRLGLS